MSQEFKQSVASEMKRVREIPRRYFPFLEILNGKMVNSMYRQPVIIAGTESEIPRLIVTSDPEDLREGATPRHQVVRYDREYDENGYPITTYDDPETGLENYCLFFHEGTPIYVFDNHSHALFAWVEAQETGILGQENVLIRFDAHSDLVPNAGFSNLKRDEVKSAIVDGQIDIQNFTDPALYNRLIQDMYLAIGARKDLIGLARSSEARAIPELNAIRGYADAGRFHDLSTMSLDNPTSVLELMQQLHTKGKKIILDIDFDIFERKEAGILKEYLSLFAHQADVVTCATSPHYINQRLSVQMAREFVQAVFR